MMTKEELLLQLNESQRNAVEYISGPELVIAGAGSGKTRVLTYKIAYLLQAGMKPWHILALTFTNKAAREMKERIAKLVGEELASHLYMGTFHSIFAHILRVEAAHLGFTSNFTIYDETDSRSLIKSIVKEMQLDEKQYKPASVHNRISMAKNHLILSTDYANDRAALMRDEEERMSEVSRIYTAYQQRLLKANAMDFDDLLVLTYQLFSKHEDVRQKYASNFEYVLVDEYQDTNYAQQQILLLLTKERQQVCAVGDDAQSIYAFRGANIDNILDFQQVYNNTRMFKLEQNYRSTQSIVKAANSLIRHNSRQIPKDVYSKNDEGDKIQLRNLQSDKEEAIVVSKEIRRLKRSEGLSWSDFAILYRTNSQSRSFEEQFLHDNVPYRVFGGMSFYQRKEIKDIIAYFRVVCNPDDEEAIKRIINYPARSIGETTIGKIAAAAQNNKVSFWDVIQQPDHYDTGLNKGTQAKLQGFVTLIQGFIDDVHQKDAYELGTQIIKVAGISADLYRSADVEAISRQENLEEFLSALQEFVEGRREEGLEDRVELSDYLQEVSLLTDADKKKDDLDRVSLMTVHSAKGLEFPAVFVVGLEDGIFPSQRSMFSMREMEEERRLLYVAITRAEKHCMLTCAKNRWRFGKMEMLPQSRFLNDINPDMLDAGHETLDVERGALNVERQHHFSNASSQSSIFKSQSSIFKSQSSKYSAGSNASSQTFNINRPLTRLSAAVSKPASSVQRSTSSVQGSLHEGTLIEHQRFGKGTIISIEGEGENQKATVKFVNTGTKQLLLKFAKFKVVER